MTIIQIEPNEGTQYHPTETQSHRTACWLAGYLAVPEELVQTVQESCGHGTLQIEGETLVGFTPLPLPPTKPAKPTAEEDRDGLLVSLEYRLMLIELGLV